MLKKPKNVPIIESRLFNLGNSIKKIVKTQFFQKLIKKNLKTENYEFSNQV